jgi:hypothetical protein
MLCTLEGAALKPEGSRGAREIVGERRLVSF